MEWCSEHGSSVPQYWQFTFNQEVTIKSFQLANYYDNGWGRETKGYLSVLQNDTWTRIMDFYLPQPPYGEGDAALVSNTFTLNQEQKTTSVRLYMTAHNDAWSGGSTRIYNLQLYGYKD